MRCVGLIVAVICLSPGDARADECPPFADSAAPAGDAAERYRFIQTTLDREARNGRLWNHAWGWGLLVTAAGQTAIGAYIEDCPACWYVSAGKAGLGVFATFILHPVRIHRLTPLDQPTCADVARAESALIAAAKSERVTWLHHAEGAAVNLAAVLYLGLEHDEWTKAILSTLVGVAVGEYRLYSRPDGAVKALSRYRRGELRTSKAMFWSITPMLGPDTVGVGVRASF